jgi:TRAP transporter TAXI family solute receptor
MQDSTDGSSRSFMWTLIAGAIIAISLGILFFQYFNEPSYGMLLGNFIPLIDYLKEHSQATAVISAAAAAVPAGEQQPVSVEQQSAPTPTPEVSPWKSFRIVSSGPTDPVWNAISEGLRLLLRENVNGSAVDSLPGSATVNIEKITVKPSEAECGFTLSFLAKAAMEGREPFKENATAIGGVANLYKQGLYLIVRPNLTIDSVGDIKANKNITLSTGSEGDVDDLLTRWLLSEYGFSYDDIESAGGRVEHNFFDMALMKLAEGSVDVISYFAPVSSMELGQLFKENKGLRVLSIDDNVTDSLVSKRDLLATVIPAGTYNGITNNITTVGSNSILVCGTELPNDVVGTVSRVMIDNRDNLTATRPEMSALNPESATKDVGIPLHPGAKAYYEGIKALKP